MKTAIFAETFFNTQHSTQLTPQRRSYKNEFSKTLYLTNGSLIPDDNIVATFFITGSMGDLFYCGM